METEHIRVTTHCLVMNMKNNVTTLLNYTIENLNSLLFSLTHRTSPEYFSRSPKLLSFHNTALMILNMIKKAIAVEAMMFFGHFDNISKIPSRQAFSEAREKISYLAFKDFFDKSCELAVAGGEDARTYKGYRLFASDGTSFFVGDLENDSIKEYFGQSTTIEGKAMCRISGIVDVLNECIVNTKVSGFEIGERVLAIEQVKELKDVNNALFLFDRGYWSQELVREICSNGQKFLMRLASNTGKTIVKNESGETLKLRRHSFLLPSGEVEILLTNLSADEVTDEELCRLYAKRWGIETKYLELKDRLQIDSFSGESANIVLQDIYATLYISNLTAFLCFEADKIIEERTGDKNNKYKQKTNRSNCISLLRDRFIRICLLATPMQRTLAMKRLVKDISANVTYINKSNPRPRDKRKIKEARCRAFSKPVL